MALIVKDRVLESSTTSGTGSFTLTGAQTGYQSFAAIGDGNETYYTIQGKNPDGTLTGEWEVGSGTYTASGTTLSRDYVSSNSLGTSGSFAQIDFSSGDKDVFVTYPSEFSLLGFTSSTSSTGSGSVVLSSNSSFDTNITVNGITLGKGSGTGIRNVAFGNSALNANTTGADNVALGYQAMFLNTTGNYNVALGFGAMAQTTTGTNNTAVGQSTLLYNRTCIENTAVGAGAIYALTKGTNPLLTTGNYNSALGVNALYANAGDYNIGVGHSAGKEITTGSYNVVIGSYDGNSGGLDIRTSNNNVVLSDGQGNIRLRINSSGNLSVTGAIVSTRITPRVSTTTSSATPTINTDNVDQYGLTAQAVDITSFTTNLSGTPTDGQKLWIYIVGTAARAITWGASFESSTATLPTTTVTTNRLDIGFVWNVATSKWRCVAVA
jgi:hypothetical protein